MLLQIKPKYQTEIVNNLNQKLKTFITAKRPIMDRWVLNELYYNGITEEALKWRFQRHERREMQTEYDPATGEETGQIYKARYITLEEELGRYRYNYRGIPTRVKDYLDDITVRDVAVACTSFTMDSDSLKFIEKLITDQVINDSSWHTIIYQIIKDILIKGNGFVMSESFDLEKEVQSWSSHNQGNYTWNKPVKMPFKRGVYTSYVNPECIFPEPYVANPSEVFIGTPMSYSELITNFPELEKMANKPNGTNYNPKYTPKEKSINATTPFNYNLANKITNLYHNYKSKDYSKLDLFSGWSSNDSWYHSLSSNQSYYNQFLPEPYFWVWKYYNLKYNPNDDNSGDYCCMFVEDYELYSGHILELDKDLPFVNFKFKKDSSEFWSGSMVSDLRPLQDDLNELSNTKKSAVELLSTTNVATNKQFLKGNFSLDKYRVNVLEVSTEDSLNQDSLTPQMTQSQPIGNIIQNLPVGNANAIALCQQEIDLLLLEMEDKYPKPFSKVQAQNEQTQDKSTFTPTVAINQIIKQFTGSLSIFGQKFIKESIQALKYFGIKDKIKRVYLYDKEIVVLDTDEQKLIQKALNLFSQYEAQTKQQTMQQGQAQAQQELAQITNDPQMDDSDKQKAQEIYQGKVEQLQNASLTGGQNPKDVIKDKKTASEVIRDMTTKGFKDETIYFTLDTLTLLGDQDLQMEIRFDRTADEILRDTKQFVQDMQTYGVTIDTGKLGERLAVLYNQDTSMLPANPPDPIISQMMSKGLIRVNSLLYPSDSANDSILQKFLGLDAKTLGFNQESATIQKFMFEEKFKHDLQLQTDTNKANTSAVAKTSGQSYLQNQAPDSTTQKSIDAQNTINPDA